MTTPLQLARAAEELEGVPFRIHGRDPADGVDCIGLLGAAMARTGRDVTLPTGYSWRLRDLSQWLPKPESCGFGKVRSGVRSGDVVLIQPGPAQFHLAIAGRAGRWVHAHAGLRRVVISAELPAGPIIEHWRLRRVRK
ncbi:MAG: NlpC/P60 family protein [Novosphingobium sp.]